MSDIKPLTKNESFCIVNEAVRQKAFNRAKQLPMDGNLTVVLCRTGSKSKKQRGLQHIWYQDIVKSGLGGRLEEDEDILDVACKYRWGIRILISERTGANADGHLEDAYLEQVKLHKNNPAKMMWWTAQMIHTEGMSNNQMAQFLTRIRDHYGYEVGVELTDPDDKGWGNLLEQAEERAA